MDIRIREYINADKELMRKTWNDFYQCIENKNLVDKFLVAVDGVGAGIGEDVIITTGSSARVAIGDANSPVDATIVGILDEKQC